MNDKIRNLLCTYIEILSSRGVHAFKRHENPLTTRERLEHVRWMCHRMLEKKDPLIDYYPDVPISDWSDMKVGRWLGFIQGQLQAADILSVFDLRDHSRPLSKL